MAHLPQKIEEVQKEKKAKDTALKTELEVAKKRAAAEEEKSKFNSKKQKLQDEESALME